MSDLIYPQLRRGVLYKLAAGAGFFSDSRASGWRVHCKSVRWMVGVIAAATVIRFTLLRQPRKPAVLSTALTWPRRSQCAELHNKKGAPDRHPSKAVRTGLEPATSGVTGQHSNQTELPDQTLFKLRHSKKFSNCAPQALVVREGFEPPTHGFSVRCSTT